MHIQAGTDTTLICYKNSVMVISAVKADPSLYRVIIDSEFKGYVQRRDGELFRVDGSTIWPDQFEEICRVMK